MMKKWSKNGSLNLSIEAIVIVVIAFVVLGLGLGFVRSQFKQFGEMAGSVQEQIKQQIQDDLARGDKKLGFPGSEITLAKKDSTVTGVGIKNVNPGSLTYKIEISELGGGTNIFGDSATVGYLDDNFLYNRDADTLAPTDTRIVPIRITSETNSGTGQFKVTIYEIDSEDNKIQYDSKSFFITVTG